MKKNKQNKNKFGYWFLGSIILAYLIIWFINKGMIISSLNTFISILRRIIFILIMVFVLIAIIDFFVKPKTLIKYFGEKSSLKGWLISIVSGIISTGPIYMWYPVLKELQNKGVKNRYIATFLYNRAIKLPLLPLLISYFGLVYTLVLTIVMVIASIFNGILVERLISFRKNG